MNDIKQIIGKNLIELRKQNSMTQAELAEKINYSDKAVSKWENGDAVPDIGVIKSLAELLGVSVDYLLEETHEQKKEVKAESKTVRNNKKIITMLSVTTVWFIATFTFMLMQIIAPQETKVWLAFVYAVPVSLIVLLVFNSIWGNRNSTFIIITALVWSVLASVYCTFLSYNLWIVFIVGIPMQVIIVLWSGIRKTKAKEKNDLPQ